MVEIVEEKRKRASSKPTTFEEMDGTLKVQIVGRTHKWFSVGICKYKPGYKSHDLLYFRVLSLVENLFLKNHLQDLLPSQRCTYVLEWPGLWRITMNS